MVEGRRKHKCILSNRLADDLGLNEWGIHNLIEINGFGEWPERKRKCIRIANSLFGIHKTNDMKLFLEIKWGVAGGDLKYFIVTKWTLKQSHIN